MSLETLIENDISITMVFRGSDVIWFGGLDERHENYQTNSDKLNILHALFTPFIPPWNILMYICDQHNFPFVRKPDIVILCYIVFLALLITYLCFLFYGFVLNWTLILVVMEYMEFNVSVIYFCSQYCITSTFLVAFQVNIWLSIYICLSTQKPLVWFNDHLYSTKSQTMTDKTER